MFAEKIRKSVNNLTFSKKVIRFMPQTNLHMVSTEKRSQLLCGLPVFFLTYHFIIIPRAGTLSQCLVGLDC